ncbi:uncharacterized protein PITG_00241 [Phytophthora infestans T30-4]|uniref:Uncharacterized protein n=1 Tax=Phytophthora infestans (strain T30-4) TaxID=403677 RepID=D0MQA9_PHYIT|nr:uncharacterized protein PITG_00241 [Phytophthora infestans T30-4]EEY57678.1 hypothetical protein PITG_00241 [Phytophthora infestans T30-4]|eukprot:XP_002908864.1 hypothetical protein PITG_00241 [Phytophthora infestans T30-4]
MLGHKTRIDKTIAGLLLHQLTTAKKIVSKINQHHSTTRVPKTEWERFVNLMDGATNQLPCRHIMHLADVGHRFDVLPVLAIHDRWSLNVKVKVAEAKDAI